jgi:pimeloyl-ACP methyl ester carboxylesterase
MADGQALDTAMNRLLRDDGETIAYLRRNGKAPGIVWLGGFHSDMQGTKAAALDAFAAQHCRAFLRFDYFGHGASSGAFRDGSISRWLEDALAVLDRLCDGPQILVASSMGAWIALLGAKARPDRIAGLLLIAPAVDFTERLMWARMPDEVRRQILETGEWLRPSAYDDGPYPITRNLIEDGRKHLLLDGAIEVPCPVRILQGMQDPDVPWQHAIELASRLSGNPLVTLVKQGDHRLSTPGDLKIMQQLLSEFFAD